VKIKLSRLYIVVFGGRAEGGGRALKFFFGDFLFGDNVFEWHWVILIQNPTPALP